MTYYICFARYYELNEVWEITCLSFSIKMNLHRLDMQVVLHWFLSKGFGEDWIEDIEALTKGLGLNK